MLLFFIKIISYFNFMTLKKKAKRTKTNLKLLKIKYFFAISVTFFLILALPLCVCYFNFFSFFFIKHFLFSFPLFPADFALNLCYKNSYWFFILILLFSYSWFFISVLIPATVAKKNSKAKGFCCFCFLSHRKTK